VRRHVPWLGCAVVVLLLSGLTLIVSEPGRTLGNWVFWTKMTLLGTGVCLTTVSAVPVRRDSFYWDKGSRRRLAGVLAIVSFALAAGFLIVTVRVHVFRNRIVVMEPDTLPSSRALFRFVASEGRPAIAPLAKYSLLI
jgi:hypothetical protein